MESRNLIYSRGEFFPNRIMSRHFLLSDDLLVRGRRSLLGAQLCPAMAQTSLSAKIRADGKFKGGPLRFERLLMWKQNGILNKEGTMSSFYSGVSPFEFSWSACVMASNPTFCRGLIRKEPQSDSSPFLQDQDRPMGVVVGGGRRSVERVRIRVKNCSR